MQSYLMVKGVLLDVSGVLLDGDRVLPGAAQCIVSLESAGLPVRFVTNTTRQSKRQLAQHLRSHGIEVELHRLFAPAAAACAWLKKNGYAPHLLVHPDLEEDFAECSTSGPCAVVIGDAAQAFGYDSLNAAFRKLQKGAPFLALARNRAFKDHDGLLSLDAGAFVEALEYAAGTKAILFGKPSRDFFTAAVESMGCRPHDVAMVGDDVESDVAGALRAGIGAGILVRTGKYRAGDERQVEPRPTAIVASIEEATQLILGMSAKGD
ncbi:MULTISPECIES: TIGR01458 family HAD-type hydrolase [unclassified Rhizobium]|uniref:TIGR01458 family HAD-type hydrolase n=1 Tax=unclassified Rhizobium TaxID=2613769 RepID=UPI001049D6EC|nr:MULTISPECIES: TIGR01458 family HAD-type hydrolase [unclassified Rhizobium]MBB4171814.1 HAD superfamily hydrolase (TIGR01458 family) [Rhizobium sp. BK538]